MALWYVFQLSIILRKKSHVFSSSGYPVIMSSYNFDRSNDAQGPPSDSNGNTDSVIVNA